MTTEVLGQYSFSEIPLAEGLPLMLNAGGVPAILSGSTLEFPIAGSGPVGRLYLDTTLNRFYRDTGTEWIDLTPSQLLNGTVGQLTVVPGTNVTPSVISLSSNPILPGTEGFVPPTGTTLQRPLVAITGEQRYNTVLKRSEEYTGSNWQRTGGGILQVVTGDILNLTGTVTVPLDNTTPLVTEGFQIFTATITPTSTTSRISVEFVITSASSAANNTIIASLFNDTTNLGSIAARTSTANTTVNMAFSKTFQTGSLAPAILSVRLGAALAGTTYCNSAGTATLGGSLRTTYTITEFE